MHRLACIQEISALEQDGYNRTTAIAQISGIRGVSASTLWNWRKCVKGVLPADWLPALASHRKGGGKKVEINQELWTIFFETYLNSDNRSITTSYREAAKFAEANSIEIPSEKTFRRRLTVGSDPKILETVEEIYQDGRDFRPALGAVRLRNAALGDHCRGILTSLQGLVTSIQDVDNDIGHLKDRVDRIERRLGPKDTEH
jgi:hypothetical protein